MVAWWWIPVTAVVAELATLLVLALMSGGGGHGAGPPGPPPSVTSRPKRFAGQRDLRLTLEEDAKGDQAQEAPTVQGGPGPRG